MLFYRSDLQILRGIAVLIVFFYHLKVIGFENGYLGVDLFFVLSGYFMAKLTEKSTVLEFYIRRLQRLFPAYLMTILITTLIVILIAIPSDTNQRIDKLLFDIFGLSNIAFWYANSYFDVSTFKPLLNLWSLGVELQFYLVVPFLFPLLRKRLILTLTVILVSLTIAMLIFTISPKTSFFMMPFRVWEFLFGALVVWYPIRILSSFWRTLLSNLILCFLLATMFFYPQKNDSLSFIYGHPGLATVCVVFFTGIVISLSMDNIIFFKGLLGRMLSKIGDYSYSIYLVHFPVIILINYIPFGGTNLGYNSLLNLLLIIFLTSVLSYLMYNYVETIRFSKKLITSIFIPLILLIIIYTEGSYINSLRFNEKQNIIFNAWNDRAFVRCGKIFRFFHPTETICQIDKVSNQKRVLLLGNCHADSIKIPFSNALQEEGFSTYLTVSNTPLMSRGITAKEIAKDISKFNIKNVVIHYSPEFFANESNLFQLSVFLKKMKKQSVDVLFISPIPIYNFHVPKMMYNNTISKKFNPEQQSKEDYFIKNKPFYKIIRQYGISDKNIFETYNFFCKQGFCMFSFNGYPAYFDDSHLTITGANILSPLFQKIAKKLVQP